jgi:ribosome-associated heat shock protein Hsp15
MTRDVAKPLDGLTERLDKWLWHARFFRTRSLAAKAAEAGVRINGVRVTRAAAAVRVGDILTFVQADRVRVVQVTGVAERRGTAVEASVLWRDVDASDTGPLRPSAP